jgi:hypothetical protein
MANIKDVHIFYNSKPVMRGNGVYANNTLTIAAAKWTDENAKKTIPFMVKGNLEVKVKAEGQQMDGHPTPLPPKLVAVGTKWSKEMKAKKLPSGEGVAEFHV